MQTKKCERCGDPKPISEFRGRSEFIMAWCKECRAIDPVGAKLVNDRLRQARLPGEALRAKDEKRAQRAREIRREVRAAQEKAYDLALDALNAIDLFEYRGREKREIQSELRRIKDVVKSLKR